MARPFHFLCLAAIAKGFFYRFETKRIDGEKTDMLQMIVVVEARWKAGGYAGDGGIAILLLIP